MTASSALAASSKMMARSVLDRIVANKIREIHAFKQGKDLSALRREALAAPPCRDFLNALTRDKGSAIVAEVKKSAPSAGELNSTVDVAKQARYYQAGGASALSVLTESRFFGGSIEDLKEAREAVDLPILRKDFILDPVQIHEARLAGADAVLLIVKALSEKRLEALYREALALGLTPMVEVHDECELEIASRLNPNLLAVNNRNLATLEISLNTTIRLRPLFPQQALTVSASGIEGPREISRLAEAGIDAFLIGTSLMRSGNPAASLTAMRQAAVNAGNNQNTHN